MKFDLNEPKSIKNLNWISFYLLSHYKVARDSTQVRSTKERACGPTRLGLSPRRTRRQHPATGPERIRRTAAAAGAPFDRFEFWKQKGVAGWLNRTPGAFSSPVDFWFEALDRLPCYKKPMIPIQSPQNLESAGPRLPWRTCGPSAAARTRRSGCTSGESGRRWSSPMACRRTLTRRCPKPTAASATQKPQSRP